MSTIPEIHVGLNKSVGVGEGKKTKGKRIYCRFCGGKLKRDGFGAYCETRNCQGAINGGRAG